MSGSSLASVTNQRLDAARRLLQQSNEMDNDWMTHSFESSALFQLRSGLNGLLQEVKTSYSLPAALELNALIHAAQEKEISIPALNELAQLNMNAQSWLSQLFTSYTAALECQIGSNAYAADVELIGRGSDAGASTKYILSSLTELVLRFREDAAEY